MRYRNYSTEKPGAGTYFACMIIGLFLGYVFLQMPGQKAVIPREEAVFLSAPLEQCNVRYQRGQEHSISLDLEGCERQFVHQICASEALAQQLRELPEGTAVELLVHPTGHDVLEIRVAGEVLLEFDRSQELLSQDAGGFGVMGLLLIPMGIYSGIRYVIEEIKFYRK